MRPKRIPANTMAKVNIGFTMESWTGHKASGQHAHGAFKSLLSRWFEDKKKKKDNMTRAKNVSIIFSILIFSCLVWNVIERYG